VASASVVIPLYGERGLTENCLAALRRVGDDIEIVLVDNDSPDDTVELLDEVEGATVVVRNDRNRGFASACNQGARAASCSRVVFLNNDTEVRAGWLEPLLAELENPRVGVVGARLLYPSGRIQHAGVAFLPGGAPDHIYRGAPPEARPAMRARDLRCVTGACFGVRREEFLELGGFDEGFENGFEDVDYCLRVVAEGARVRYRGDSVTVHHESMSEGRHDANAANWARLRMRWPRIESDWACILDEDGIAGPIWADTAVVGPILARGNEGERIRSLVEALVVDGRAPMAREDPLLPLPVSACSDAVLAAICRHGIGASNAIAYLASGRARRGVARYLRLHDTPGGGWRLVLPKGEPLEVGTSVPALQGLDARVRSRLRLDGGRPGVNLIGPLHGRDGAAAAGRGMVSASLRAGLATGALALDVPEEGATSAPRPRRLTFSPTLHVIRRDMDDSPFWDDVSAKLAAPIVAIADTGTSRLPDGWSNRAERLDEIWVPSHFGARVWAEGGVPSEKIKIVPTPVDCDVFSPGVRPRAESERFEALAVLNWSWRAGWDVALRAWAEEFRSGESARLRVLARVPSESRSPREIEVEVSALLAGLPGGPEGIADIELILGPLANEGLVSLYREADVLLAPAREAAVGMPVLEAMACGTPVIAGESGVHEDLLDTRNGYPVEVDLREIEHGTPAGDGYRGLLVREPRKEGVRRALRAAYEERGDRTRGANAVAAVRESNSIDACGYALRQRVLDLIG